MVDDGTTWVARLTPPGQGAIATLGLIGPQAWSVTRALFHPQSKSVPESLLDVESSQFWFGRLGQDLTDEVVLTVKGTDPTPWVEVHCHGGDEVVRLLIETFEARGAQVCDWSFFLSKTTVSVLEREAVQALTQARTARTAGILLDQQQGALTRALGEIRRAIDEERFTDAKAKLERVLRFHSLGRHLTDPWRIAIAGAPNVGKSSLINALAGHQRAIVSEAPGTTRDVVSITLAVDGWPMELLDTAGIREQTDELEKAGIDLALSTLDGVDFCWWLIETTADPELPPETLRIPTQLVLNKTDLPPTWAVSQVPDALRISTLTGEGIDELCEDLTSRLVPEVPQPGEAVPVASESCDNLLRELQLKIDSQLPARSPADVAHDSAP